MRRGAATLVGATAISASLMAGSASADVITVTSSVDPAGTASECTLRQALEAANTNDTPAGSNCASGGGADDIVFDQTVVPSTIILTAGELTVSSDVTILGPGADQLTINANEASRVFHVTAGTSIFDGIHIFNGLVNLPAAGPPGGGGVAIESGATLTIDDSVVDDHAVSANLNGGSIPIAQGYGGGILNAGTLTVRDTSIHDNSIASSAVNGDLQTIAVAAGAAIANVNGALTVDRSTIEDNDAEANTAFGASTATQTRGAIANFINSGADAAITSSTIVDNSLTNGTSDSTTQTGGGVYANDPMSLTSSTVTGNSTPLNTGENLFVDVDGSIALRNTIVAEAANTQGNCSGVDSQGYNWADDTTCDFGSSDVHSQAPHLLTLADYGGRTPTRPPEQPNGVDPTVIDQGINSTPTLSTDQRGLDRTVNYDIDDASGGDGTDVGAVEIQGAEITDSNPSTPGDEPDPIFFGTSELDTNVSLFDGGACGGTALFTNTAGIFAESEENDNRYPGSFGADTTNQVSVNAAYGTATSDCAPFTYQRVPHEPEPESTDPASGANDNSPKVKGSIDTGLSDPADVTIDVYGSDDCTGPVLGTGTAEDFEDGAGVPTTVPDNSTTTFYATSSGVGGTSECSEASVTYTEVTPPPVNPPVNPPVTPTTKKCKKGFVKKKVKGKTKCVKKKKKK